MTHLQSPVFPVMLLILIILASDIQEDLRGEQGKYIKWGPAIRIVQGGLGAHPQEILHALKCVLGTPEALFHTCI